MLNVATLPHEFGYDRTFASTRQVELPAAVLKIDLKQYAEWLADTMTTRTAETLVRGSGPVYASMVADVFLWTASELNAELSRGAVAPSQRREFILVDDGLTWKGARLEESVGRTVSLRVWPAIDRVLAEWSTLEHGWDDESTPALEKGLVESAKVALLLASQLGVPMPRPYITGDGEFGFNWKNGEAVATASFLPDGHFVGYCYNPALGDPIEIDALASADLDLRPFFTNIVEFCTH